jgi:hypothetical protein
MKTYQVNDEGFYGNFGGAYIPEILYQCVEQLKDNYRKVLDSDDFRQEFHSLLRDYVGRPSPLYLAKRLSERYGCRIYLKREDLNHTGAHKINNAIGQVLLARRMGKKRIIAETGAGQHGVATATVCALMSMECVVYMGKTDVERQRVNVERMKMLGARVEAVTSGNMTLKDATNEAIRDWCCHPSDTYYVIGSTVVGAGLCGRFFCIDQSMRRYCAVVATPLSAPCWQRVQTWSGRGVSECFLMLVCRILCGIQPLLQFLCGRCRVRSFRSANEWHRFPVRIPSGRS